MKPECLWNVSSTLLNLWLNATENYWRFQGEGTHPCTTCPVLQPAPGQLEAAKEPGDTSGGLESLNDWTSSSLFSGTNTGSMWNSGFITNTSDAIISTFLATTLGLVLIGCFACHSHKSRGFTFLAEQESLAMFSQLQLSLKKTPLLNWAE